MLKKLIVVLFVAATLACLVLSEDIQPLRIGAFNVQVLGASKLSKSHVVDVLVKIILRYDIILIQEIRDSTGKAIHGLMEQINRAAVLRETSDGVCDAQTENCDESQDVYGLLLSDRLGRTTSKEQYAYIYRKSRVGTADAYHYDDGSEEERTDHFEREPFIARFSSPSTLIKDFAIISIHTKPSDAVKEIDMLVDVYDDVVDRWGIEDVLIVGDYNGACNYVKMSDWENIRLRSQERFQWLIKDNVDTNVAGAICAYDRIVAAGDQLIKSVWPETAAVFRFDVEYGLTHEEAEEVSDHYPVEIALLPALSEGVLSYINVAAGFVVSDNRKVSSATMEQLIKFDDTVAGCKLDKFYDKDGQLAKVSLVVEVEEEKDALHELEQLQRKFPGLVSPEIYAVVKSNVLHAERQATLSSALNPLRCRSKLAQVTCTTDGACDLSIFN
ncbi:deoxyribonuclease-1-like isoform X2 [Ptychodera flava]